MPESAHPSEWTPEYGASIRRAAIEMVFQALDSEQPDRALTVMTTKLWPGQARVIQALSGRVCSAVTHQPTSRRLSIIHTDSDIGQTKPGMRSTEIYVTSRDDADPNFWLGAVYRGAGQNLGTDTFEPLETANDEAVLAHVRLAQFDATSQQALAGYIKNIWRIDIDRQPNL